MISAPSALICDECIDLCVDTLLADGASFRWALYMTRRSMYLTLRYGWRAIFGGTSPRKSRGAGADRE
jgi:hypothetical protein